MNNFKRVGIYKTINILLLVVVSALSVFIYEYFRQGYCIDKCSFETMNGVLKPLSSGSQILAVILAALLFVPSHIFRKWLIFVAPVIILITINRVIAVSVYASGIGTIDKIHMAQLGMCFLGIVTALFVAGHLMYDRRKNKLVK